VSVDVKLESTGKRENLEMVRVRLPAKCRTCGRDKGAVPSWEKTTDLMVCDLQIVRTIVG